LNKKDEYGICIKEFTARLQEHCMQYCLEKTIGCKTLEEFQDKLKKEIGNIHKKNMGIMDCKINGSG
jgi:hypothetical protein